ncbi:Ankyrin repeat-containing protein [Balamuthia mandrillaris]
MHSPRHRNEWKIDPAALTFTDKLGAGASAKVYKGLYQGKEVAIKILKHKFEGDGSDARAIRDFEHECEIMSKVSSPYILRFYGSCLEPQVCIVVDYCSRGSLYDVLQDETMDITWGRCFKWAHEMVLAIQALHNNDPPIFHRDLKTPNLLLDQDWSIKVCDFGASRVEKEDASTLGKLRGTYAYCAPEIYFKTKFTTKSDVYSIGIILWEFFVRCLTGKYQKPYSEFPQLTLGFAVIIKTAKSQLRPTVPDNMPTEIADLIRKCWHPVPEERPECSEVLSELNALEQLYETTKKEEWNALRTIPENAAKPKERRSYLSRTESMRQPLMREHLNELAGFSNVRVHD